MVMFERPDQPHDDDLIDEVPPLPPARLPAEIRAPINYNRDVLGVDLAVRKQDQSV